LRSRKNVAEERNRREVLLIHGGWRQIFREVKFCPASLGSRFVGAPGPLSSASIR
jgi:hypothetical protein